MAGSSLALALPASSAFDLEFVDVGGRLRRGSLSLAWNVPFEAVEQARSFPLYRGMRNFPGWRWSASSGRHVGFESWLERDNAMLLDFDPRVVAYSAQPFWLHWHDGNKPRRHCPDYFARLDDGTGLVVDVRADDNVDDEAAKGFAAMAAACAEVGWQFRRVGEPDPVFAANVRWLGGYRYGRCGNPEIEQRLRQEFARPAPLFAGVAEVGPRLAVLPVLYHLMWRRVLGADLGSAPLLPGTLVGPAAQIDVGTPHGDRPAAAIRNGRRIERASMTLTRPGVLRIGDRVRLDDVLHTVTGLPGTTVLLADDRGTATAVTLTDLYSRAEFEPSSAPPRPPLPASALGRVSPEQVAEARRWEGHILEVLTGLAPDAAPNARPRPQYDPATQTLAQREQAKVAELREAGFADVSERTLRRRRAAYEAGALPGLVDGRAGKGPSPHGRVDPRVVDALARVIEAAIDEPTRTAGYHMVKVSELLEDEYGPDSVAMPSRATFYRLFDKMTKGRHITGSARTRRSIASRPETPFGVFTVVRPGELMQIDSTPLDVEVLLERGVRGRLELTGLIDVATRTVTAGVLRPAGTKAVDASLLLARTVTPEPMRLGWIEALHMSRSVLPFEHMLDIDDRIAHAAARPVIVPETIVFDQGKVFVSDNFRASCLRLNIDLQPAPPGSPDHKPHIEKMMDSVGTLFAQYVAGYVGRSVERRGRGNSGKPLWSHLELQEMLDEWLVAGWQNRPHDGLRDPLAPGRTFTPNQKYASLVQAAGYVPVALTAEDYIELLPARWQAINSYGVKIKYRTYDGLQLNGLRRQPSGVKAKKDLWEIHHDPYDVSRIWVRNHRGDGEWIMLFWKHLRSAPTPFGDLAWDHALAGLRAEGVKSPTELEIAERVTELLRVAGAGPAPAAKPAANRRRDDRVAARTHAVSSSVPEQSPALPPDQIEADYDSSGSAQEEQLAEVIPLGIFDAREEAKKWR